MPIKVEKLTTKQRTTIRADNFLPGLTLVCCFFTRIGTKPQSIFLDFDDDNEGIILGGLHKLGLWRGVGH